MPGDIKFVISGDSSKYEAELKRISDMADETKRRVDGLYKKLQMEDAATDTMVNETVNSSEIKLNNVSTSIDAKLVELDKLEAKRQETETRVKFTVSGMLIGLRAVTDIAALVSVATGEQIDVQYLSMISMGISAVMQVQLQAAVYAATPGGQPLALMMLAMIPMLTGFLTIIKQEQLKSQRRLDKRMDNQFETIIDGVGM